MQLMGSRSCMMDAPPAMAQQRGYDWGGDDGYECVGGYDDGVCVGGVCCWCVCWGGMMTMRDYGGWDGIWVMLCQSPYCGETVEEEGEHNDITHKYPQTPTLHHPTETHKAPPPRPPWLHCTHCSTPAKCGRCGRNPGLHLALNQTPMMMIAPAAPHHSRVPTPHTPLHIGFRCFLMGQNPHGLRMGRFCCPRILSSCWWCMGCRRWGRRSCCIICTSC